MTDFKQCNRCATNCEHNGAIRLCICGKHTKPSETNGDMIRNMTDEELADFLISVKAHGAVTADLDCYYDDEMYELDWVKSATKE